MSDKHKDLFITQLPFVVCAINSSRNRFPFCSEDWHFILSISPFLIDPLGKSGSLCLFIKLDMWMCCLSMRFLSFPPPIWSLSDSNIYMMSPLPDVCNSSRGIRCGARQCGTKSNPGNLILRLFLYHFLPRVHPQQHKQPKNTTTMMMEALAPPAAWIRWIYATQMVGSLAHKLSEAVDEGFCWIH